MAYKLTLKNYFWMAYAIELMLLIAISLYQMFHGALVGQHDIALAFIALFNFERVPLYLVIPFYAFGGVVILYMIVRGDKD